MTDLIPIAAYFDPKSNQIVQVPERSPISGHILHSGQYMSYNSLKTRGFEPIVTKLKVKLLSENATLPTRSNPTDAGLDLYAAEDAKIHSRFSSGKDAYEQEEDLSRVIVKTDIAVEVPPGLGLFIWDRSGFSAKKGAHRVAGVVDSSYRGNIQVALVNLSNKTIEVKKGDRIAQAILAPIVLAEVEQVDELSDTNRGSDGFGSTGQ